MKVALPPSMCAELVGALSDLVKAAQRVDKLWSEDDRWFDERNDIMSAPYPLSPGFDEVVSLLEQWRDDVAERVLTSEERVARVLHEIVSNPEMKNALYAAGVYMRAADALKGSPFPLAPPKGDDE